MLSLWKSSKPRSFNGLSSNSLVKGENTRLINFLFVRMKRLEVTSNRKQLFKIFSIISLEKHHSQVIGCVLHEPSGIGNHATFVVWRLSIKKLCKWMQNMDEKVKRTSVELLNVTQLKPPASSEFRQKNWNTKGLDHQSTNIHA